MATETAQLRRLVVNWGLPEILRHLIRWYGANELHRAIDELGFQPPRLHLRWLSRRMLLDIVKAGGLVPAVIGISTGEPFTRRRRALAAGLLRLRHELDSVWQWYLPKHERHPDSKHPETPLIDLLSDLYTKLAENNNIGDKNGPRVRFIEACLQAIGRQPPSHEAIRATIRRQ